MLKKYWWLASLACVGIVVIVAATAIPGDGGSTDNGWSVTVVNAFPHDPASFSQGLAVEGETLFEGTGKYGASLLRKMELTTGRVELQIPLGPKYFGEGITVLGDRIYQLTWKERVCVVYDKQSLKPLGSLSYSGEGWGLADDETHLYMSDGSSTIRVIDPSTFRVLRRIAVREGRRRVDKLNELEFVDGELYANIWYSDLIARIDPETGRVLGWIDCSTVYPAAERPDREHVLNGIAYDGQAQRLFITGKNWPQLYEIRVDATP